MVRAADGAIVASRSGARRIRALDRHSIRWHAQDIALGPRKLPIAAGWAIASDGSRDHPRPSAERFCINDRYENVDFNVSVDDTGRSGGEAGVAIKSFADDATRLVFEGRQPKRLPASIVSVARRKLKMVHAADALTDLKRPPGNRLHPLTGDRAGQHAIWINDQYRLCFRWTSSGPEDVEIVDYH